jgi:hypothetical protein
MFLFPSFTRSRPDMPAPDEILAGLKDIANTWQLLAVLWHLCLAIFVVLLLAGRRPSMRLAGILLVLPLLSVSIVAALSANPFNALLFGLASITLLVLCRKLPDQPVRFSPLWIQLAGVILLAFGWVYPHFLETSSLLAFLYAAPTGLIPCPTLSAVIGIALLLDGLGSRAFSLVLGVTGMLYGVIGVWRLDVAIDWFLVAGSALILWLVFFRGEMFAQRATRKR